MIMTPKDIMTSKIIMIIAAVFILGFVGRITRGANAPRGL
jgi:hypothetical protein